MYRNPGGNMLNLWKQTAKTIKQTDLKLNVAHYLLIVGTTEHPVKMIVDQKPPKGQHKWQIVVLVKWYKYAVKKAVSAATQPADWTLRWRVFFQCPWPALLQQAASALADLWPFTWPEGWGGWGDRSKTGHSALWAWKPKSKTHMKSWPLCNRPSK